MHFNWGTGIALFYGAFALSMIGVVFVSRKHDPGLVQKNYYELDLNYQARMDQKQNTAQLDALPLAQFDASAETIRISFPDDMADVKGTVKLFRSAVTGDDFVIKIDNNPILEIPAKNLAPGRWHLELDWEVREKKYFMETALFISHR